MSPCSARRNGGWARRHWADAENHLSCPRGRGAFRSASLLTAHCSGCHSTLNTRASGAQAPIHSDADVGLAHEYALTRVSFRDPEESKLVVRMVIDPELSLRIWDRVTRGNVEGAVTVSAHQRAA